MMKRALLAALAVLLARAVVTLAAYNQQVGWSDESSTGSPLPSFNLNSALIKGQENVVKVRDGLAPAHRWLDLMGMGKSKDMSKNKKKDMGTSKQIRVPGLLISYYDYEPSEPSKKDYEKLRKATKEFYYDFFSALNDNLGFQSIRLKLKSTQYSSEKNPLLGPQYAVTYEAVLTFQGNPSLSSEQLRSVMQSADYDQYVKRYVNVLVGTPFETVYLAVLSNGELATNPPSITPTQVNVRGLVFSYYDNFPIAATADDYERLRAATQLFYDDYLANLLNATADLAFEGIELTLVTSQYFPVPASDGSRYQLKMDATISFSAGTASPRALFHIMKYADFALYVTNYVNTLTGTPFITVYYAVLSRGTVDTLSPAPSISPAPSLSTNVTSKTFNVGGLLFSYFTATNGSTPVQPTSGDYESLRQVTQEFYILYFALNISSQVIGFSTLNMTIANTTFVPNGTAPYMVTFNALFTFHGQAASKLTSAQLSRLMKMADLNDYTANYVNSLLTTPFQYVNFTTLTVLAVPTPAPSPSPVPNPSPQPSVKPSKSFFKIDLDLTSVPSSFQSLFTAAATRWQSIIIGDVPNVTLTSAMRNMSMCKNLPGVIDDIYICAFVVPIDGPGNILGQSAPIFLRTQSNLPIVGFMQFDIADFSVTTGGGVVRHEMGHVLGITNSVWKLDGLINNNTPPCTYPANSNASRAYQALSGCASTVPVPIEQTGGSGTACTHWSEACFNTELMTGVQNGALPLSTVTVGGLADLGYQVNYSAADAYSSADMGASCLCKRRELRNPLEWSQNPGGIFRAKKLSAPGREAAIAYGKRHLEKMKESKGNYEGMLQYLGDRLVSVTYLDGDDIATVEVTDDTYIGDSSL